MLASTVSLDLVAWIAAIVFYGFGDYLTTVLAVRRSGVVGANPAVRYLLSEQPTPIGFAVLKLTAVGLCAGGYFLIRGSSIAVWIPIVLAVLGVGVTISNVRTLRRRNGAR